MSIAKSMTIAEVIRNYPETVATFQEFGMHCLGCPSATGESLEKAAAVHGFDADELVAALNKVLVTK